MKTKAVIIDDERKSIAILKDRLGQYCPYIDVIAESESPIEGLALINQLQPQLVFLVIAMPEMSGFDLLAQIREPSFELVFVTAFDQYALEAIKNCAIGYLLKPIDNMELIATVTNAIKNVKAKTALTKNKLLIENFGINQIAEKKIVIPSVDGLELIKVEDIIHCEGNDGYTRIHCKEKKILSSQSIGHYKKMLISKNFYLIHKSHLINLAHIEKYQNDGYVQLSNKDKVPVSVNRRADFKNYLNSINSI